jgi:Raf kinase inhibitor-like YbhB/YbcL family protein
MAMIGGERRRRQARWISGAVALGVASCSSAPAGSGEAEELGDQPLDTVITVTSAAFAEGEAIPPEFTCDGEDASPPLSWNGVPTEAVELAVVVDDPDAGGGTYVHWVLFGLDPSSTGLQRGVAPTGGGEAENSAGDVEYKGPCPPEGDLHHYRFAVYALGEEIGAADGAGADDVLERVRETAIAKGTLTGTYQR